MLTNNYDSETRVPCVYFQSKLCPSDCLNHKGCLAFFSKVHKEDQAENGDCLSFKDFVSAYIEISMKRDQITETSETVEAIAEDTRTALRCKLYDPKNFA